MENLLVLHYNVSISWTVLCYGNFVFLEQKFPLDTFCFLHMFWIHLECEELYKKLIETEGSLLKMSEMECSLQIFSWTVWQSNEWQKAMFIIIIKQAFNVSLYAHRNCLNNIYPWKYARYKRILKEFVSRPSTLLTAQGKFSIFNELTKWTTLRE